MGLGHRWREVEKTYAEVNRLFGDIVKVTPSSKVVGDMAIISAGQRNASPPICWNSTSITISLCRIPWWKCSAAPWRASRGVAEEIAAHHSSWPRPAERTAQREPAPVEFRRRQRQNWKRKSAHPVRPTMLLSYLLYPEVYLKYDKFRQTYADVSVLPTPAFFYGLKPAEEITVEIESGKTMIVKFLTISEAHPDGTRTLFFELNGQPREVNVRDRALRVVERSHPKANPADPGQVGAPTAGLDQRHRRAGEPQPWSAALNF